jgi:hypothetical protein
MLSEAVQDYARAPLSGQMGFNFDESKHPRAKGPKVGGQFVAGDHGASHTFPEAGGRYGFTAHITGRDEKGHVQIKSEMGTAIVPQESMQHFYSDMTGDVSYLKKHGSSEHAAVDNVIHGGAELLGRGDDSVVWKSGNQVVKSSTTLPYHPMSGWVHGLPHEAAAKAQKQHDMTEEMRAAGVQGIPKQETVQHGDRLFTVRDHLDIPEKLNEQQLLQARDHLKSMHDAGYSVNDQLQFGVGADGNVYHFDLGKADKTTKKNYHSGETDDASDDRKQMRDLFDKSGVRYDPSREELERNARRVLQSIKLRGGIDNLSDNHSLRKQLGELEGAMYRDKHPWSDYIEGVKFGATDEEITNDMGVEVPAGIYDDPKSVKAATEAYAKPLAGQMGFNFDEQKHPRETTSHDTKHAGEFAPKQQAPVPDGKVKMVQAPKGGAHSNVNGKFYKGGHWMPVHGLSAGKPKPKPKPKADPFGGAPVADPDGKGRAPMARQMSPEQIAEQKERDDEKRKWAEVQAGPVSDLYWVGDYPGKTNYHVTKTMRPALTAMTPEQVAAIGKFTRKALIANDIAEVKADREWETDTPEERQEILDYIPEAYQQQRDSDDEMFVTKKLRKSHPAMGDAIHGLRDYVNLPDQPAAFQKLHRFLTKLQKPVTSAVDDYARPLANQMGFNFNENDHPREATGKTEGGQFAKKPGASRHAAWAARRHKHGDHPTSFLSGHSSKPVREAAKENAGLGLLITPHTQSYIAHIPDYSHIALDNGVYSEFTGSAPFSHNKFMDMLHRVAVAPGAKEKVQFVVAPDRVGDWQGTIERSRPYFAKIRALGFPVAFAAQDGIEDHMDQIPWDDFDVLFMGGSTPWKLGFDPKGQYKDHFRPTDDELRKAGMLPNHIKLQKEANRRGKRIHMGRVNSHKRMVEMAHYGMQADTADGNYIGVAPDKNLPDVLDWLGKTGGDQFTDEKRGPAGLTRKEAIDKAMANSSRNVMSHEQAKRATWFYLGQDGEGWKSAEVTDMHEEDGKMSPVFSVPPDCKPVETVHHGDGSQGACQLCGTTIKNHFKIVNHDRKEVMDVGSECVQGFAPDGMNGEKDAKRQMHDKRRGVVEQLHGAIKEFAAHSEGGEDSWGDKIHRGSATLQQVAKGIGNEESRNRFWRVSRSLGIDPYSGSWFMDSKKGVTHTGEFQLHNNQNAAGAASTDRKIANWHKKHGEDAEQVIKDLHRFMGKDQYSLSGSVTRYARAVQHSQGVRAYANYIEGWIN